MTPDEVVEQALALPMEARAELVEKLLASLEQEDWAEIDPALAEEAEKRIDALDRGEDRSYPAAEVIKDLLARVKK
jgi:Putative addiction module component